MLGTSPQSCIHHYTHWCWASATVVEKVRPREGSRRGRQEWRQKEWPLVARVAVVVVAVAVAFVVAAWVVVVWVVAAWVVAAWFFPNQKNNA